MVKTKLTIIIFGSIYQCSSSYSSTPLEHRSHDYGHAVDDANDVNNGHDGHGNNVRRKTSKRRLEPRRSPFNTGTNNGSNEDNERDDRSYNGGSSYGYDSSSNSGYNSQNQNSYGGSSSYGGSPSSSISSSSSYGSSSYGGSNSGGSYSQHGSSRSRSSNRGYNNFSYDLPRIPLAWVILIIISNTAIAILLTAHQFENNPEGIFANFCRLCNNTLDCLYRLVYNCYHCRLNEIPTVVCAEDGDEDAYTEQELHSMKLRPGVGRALEVEHHKAMRKTLQKNTSTKGSKKAPPRR